MDSEPAIGRRIREIRAWRDLSLTATAELAGLSTGYLSRIERGHRPVERRSTVEALADALRVTPAELTGQPFPPADPITADARSTVADLEAIFTTPALGESDAPPGRPWPEVRADLHTLNTAFRPAADYAAQGRMLPGLLTDLHAAMSHEPRHRREALIGLIDAYHAAEELTKTLGFPGLPVLAAMHAQTVAEELDEPAYLGLTAWLRGITVGPASRHRMLAVSRRAADDLRPHLRDSSSAQAFGAVQLNAALASAVRGDPEGTAEHLREAQRVADTMPDDSPPFGALYFGRNNVGIWRVTLAVEHGEPGKAGEIARGVDPTEVPSKARQAMFYGDLGRGLATEKQTRGEAISAIRTAEEIAPSMIRNNYLIRETVTDLLRRARREAGGRELRGMAYRMGVPG